MNTPRAKALAAKLSNQEVGGWRVEGYLSHGKSAVVLHASKPGQPKAALKVFDQELIERFGHTAQVERVTRELSLRGKYHPHLVEILDGGTCAATDYVFIVTRLLEGWRNLAECLQDVPADRTYTLLEQVASAAQFLETIDVVHRDIKPANIVVDALFQNAVLLDLGVIRPLNASAITDDDTFVGTHQYSSPEFLFGEEEHSLEGGRALTFYQLGAVLHDLLMKTPLFHEHRRHARMVEAVKNIVPKITSTDDHLAQLARNCLLKDPKKRLAVVSWRDFQASSHVALSPRDAARQRIRHRLETVSAEGETEASSGEPSIEDLVESARRSLQDAASAETVLPPREVVRFPTRASDRGFDFILARSSPHGLRLPLAIRFTFRSIGEGAAAVSVSCAAVLTAQHPPTAYEHWRTIFQGAAEKASIVDAMMGHILLLVDRAQRMQEAGTIADPLHITDLGEEKA